MIILRRVTFVMILTILICMQLNSFEDTGNSPDWFMLEQGRTAVINRELGDALRIFRTILGNAAGEGRAVPEAEMWLGFIFEQEGEIDLAIEQYNRALENADLLYVKEDRYTILYRLANIYSTVYKHGKYEQTLNRIISEGSADDHEQGAALIYMQEAMFNTLLRDGIDKLFILYRKDERKLQPAYSMLGLYHYRTGFYREAVRNYITDLVTPVTNVVSYRRNKDFEYEYNGLSSFIFESYEDPFLKDYLEEVSFIKDLYYLGASLHAMGSTGIARTIWRSILSSAPDSQWRDRSNRQLTKPFIEPLLVPGDYE